MKPLPTLLSGAAAFAVILTLAVPRLADQHNTLAFKEDCERMVKSRLKAPTTAIFEHTVVTDTMVDGVVYSQNSFGAMTTSKVQCATNATTGIVRYTLNYADIG